MIAEKGVLTYLSEVEEANLSDTFGEYNARFYT